MRTASFYRRKFNETRGPRNWIKSFFPRREALNEKGHGLASFPVRWLKGDGGKARYRIIRSDTRARTGAGVRANLARGFEHRPTGSIPFN